MKLIRKQKRWSCKMCNRLFIWHRNSREVQNNKIKVWAKSIWQSRTFCPAQWVGCADFTILCVNAEFRLEEQERAVSVGNANVTRNSPTHLVPSLSSKQAAASHLTKEHHRRGEHSGSPSHATKILQICICNIIPRKAEVVFLNATLWGF